MRSEKFRKLNQQIDGGHTYVVRPLLLSDLVERPLRETALFLLEVSYDKRCFVKTGSGQMQLNSDEIERKQQLSHHVEQAEAQQTVELLLF
jgi:hypothetical protein